MRISCGACARVHDTIARITNSMSLHPRSSSSPADSEEGAPRSRADDDPRDQAAVWLHHIWDDGAPRSWGTVGWVHVCGTSKGALNATAQLTKWVQPLSDQPAILGYMQRLFPTPPPGKIDTTPFLEIVAKWASLMNSTFLIAEDRGGGELGDVWKTSTSSAHNNAGAEMEQVTLREAQRTFRTHGTILAIDMTHLKTVSLLHDPERTERMGGLDKLLHFSLDVAQRGLLAPFAQGQSAGAAIPRVRVLEPQDEGALRARRAIDASAAALATAAV